MRGAGSRRARREGMTRARAGIEGRQPAAACRRPRRSAPAARDRRRGASARAPRAGRSCGASASRSGAVAATARWPGRRHSTPQVRPSRAATASRRSTRSSCGPSHANAAPHSGARSACSYAHSWSAALLQRTMSEPREVEPRRGQRRRVRHVRRRDPDDVAAVRLQPRERRQREADLADAFAREHDLGQRASRPAAAGQHGVELGKAATASRRARARSRRRARSRGSTARSAEQSGIARRRSSCGNGSWPTTWSVRRFVPVSRVAPPIAFAARRSSSSGGTSSTWVARYQW